MAAGLVQDPRGGRLPPRERALAGLAALLTEAPWTVVADDIERALAAGLSSETIAHLIAQVAYFNYLNRVADATGIEYDRDVVIAPPDVDAGKEPLPRQERSSWPPPAPAPEEVLAIARPHSAEAFVAWREHVLARDAPLSLIERRCLARVAADALADVASVDELEPSIPPCRATLRGIVRAERLEAYAWQLTVAPWRVGRGDVDDLRGLGLDDAAILDAITVIAFQNAASRMRLGLAAWKAAMAGPRRINSRSGRPTS